MMTVNGSCCNYSVFVWYLVVFLVCRLNIGDDSQITECLQRLNLISLEGCLLWIVLCASRSACWKSSFPNDFQLMAVDSDNICMAGIFAYDEIERAFIYDLVLRIENPIIPVLSFLVIVIQQ